MDFLDEPDEVAFTVWKTPFKKTVPKNKVLQKLKNKIISKYVK